MKCKSIYFLKHFFATKGAIYLVVYIATVITSRVKVCHVFARKLTWHFTGVIISHNKIKNFAVPSGKTEERRLYSHIKNGFEIFILQEPRRGFILSSGTCWIDGCPLSYLAGKTIPVISGLYRYQEDMPKYCRYNAKVRARVKRASRLKP